MNLNTIETIFQIGKFILFTPSSHTEKKPSRKKRLYGFVLIIFYTVGLFSYIPDRIPTFKTRTLMHSVILVITDLNIYFSLVWLPIMVTQTTQSWYHLVRDLTKVCRSETNSKYSFFVFVSIPILCSFVMEIKIIQGLRSQFVAIYFLYFYHAFVLICFHFRVYAAVAVLQMLQQGYQSQKKNIHRNILTCVDSYQISKRFVLVACNLFILKKCVSYFNQIFGWSIMFSHIDQILRLLTYLDDLVRTPDSTKPQDQFKLSVGMVALLIIIILFWISTIRLFLLCDQILKEFDQILNALARIKHFVKGTNSQKYSLKGIKRCQPTFFAGKFYTIERSLIPSIFNTIITFFIVIIQFKIN
ncbi:gustatory receptor 75 [Tribolium castaneum]|uniref:Gustatory receptor n=1 Tax=Tribolium castaneum TaxID=7070 RepID=D2A6G8_TRICA|nr:gustatory receptor 75 [Tribolium castaneum]